MKQVKNLEQITINSRLLNVVNKHWELPFLAASSLPISAYGSALGEFRTPAIVAGMIVSAGVSAIQSSERMRRDFLAYSAMVFGATIPDSDVGIYSALAASFLGYFAMRQNSQIKQSH